MKDKLPNVKMNSLSEENTSPTLKLPSLKPPKPSKVLNNN
jgi:hypothetical protein